MVIHVFLLNVGCIQLIKDLLQWSE